MSGRDAILARIGARIGARDEARARRAVAARLADHERHLTPERTRLDRAGLVALFAERARAVDATLETVAGFAEVPGAVARYVRDRNLPPEAVRAPHPDLDGLPWRDGTLTVRARAPGDEDRIGINRPFCALAETGTLVFASGPRSPATMNFLPETHIAVLAQSEIVPGLEEAWDLLRAAGLRGGALPRTVNLVTGPSRTGDIEQILQRGVHGPRHLHVLLLSDAT